MINRISIKKLTNSGWDIPKWLRKMYGTRIDIINGEEFEVPYNYSPPVYNFEKINSGSNVILVRHANSKFNLDETHLDNKEGYGESMMRLFQNEKHRDSELSDFGIAQSKYASKIANQLDIGTVIISPLARAIQTTYYFIKDHPNFDNINFILHPDLREHIFGTGELSLNLSHKIENVYKNMFPHLNTDLMLKDVNNPSLGYDELFYWKDTQDEISGHIGTMTQQEIDEIILKVVLEKRFPRSVVTLEHTLDRCLRMKKYISDYIKSLSDDQKQKKILVVGHSVYFKFWTGNWSSMTPPYMGLPKEHYYLSNCEFYPDNRDFPRESS